MLRYVSRIICFSHYDRFMMHFLFFCQQQENAIQTMELRNYFSLFCLHQETQLIFIYLPITSHILGAFVNSQVQGHREVRESSFLQFFPFVAPRGQISF